LWRREKEAVSALERDIAACLLKNIYGLFKNRSTFYKIYFYFLIRSLSYDDITPYNKIKKASTYDGSLFLSLSTHTHTHTHTHTDVSGS
jgi:hypothetical protein